MQCALRPDHIKSWLKSAYATHIHTHTHTHMHTYLQPTNIWRACAKHRVPNRMWRDEQVLFSLQPSPLKRLTGFELFFVQFRAPKHQQTSKKKKLKTQVAANITTDYSSISACYASSKTEVTSFVDCPTLCWNHQFRSNVTCAPYCCFLYCFMNFYYTRPIFNSLGYYTIDHLL